MPITNSTLEKPQYAILIINEPYLYLYNIIYLRPSNN